MVRRWLGLTGVMFLVSVAFVLLLASMVDPGPKEMTVGEMLLYAACLWATGMTALALGALIIRRRSTAPSSGPGDVQ